MTPVLGEILFTLVGLVVVGAVVFIIMFGAAIAGSVWCRIFRAGRSAAHHSLEESHRLLEDDDERKGQRR